MSQKINIINELKRYQSLLSKKILLKFGINDSSSKDSWGWFVDPESNDIFNKNKYNQNIGKLKHISIPSTIQEYPKTIRSLKSMNNFHDESEIYNKSNKSNKSNKNKNISIYANIVGIITFVSLIYVLIIL
jgi:hypothetical protein